MTLNARTNRGDGTPENSQSRPAHVESDCLVVGIHIIKPFENRNQSINGHLAFCRAERLQDLIYTTGVFRTNSDVDQSSFEVCDLKAFSLWSFCCDYTKAARLLPAEDRDLPVFVAEGIIRSALAVSESARYGLLGEGS